MAEADEEAPKIITNETIWSAIVAIRNSMATKDDLLKTATKTDIQEIRDELHLIKARLTVIEKTLSINNTNDVNKDNDGMKKEYEEKQQEISRSTPSKKTGAPTQEPSISEQTNTKNTTKTGSSSKTDSSSTKTSQQEILKKSQ